MYLCGLHTTPRVETKTLFFAQNFLFCESFHEKLLFTGWFSRKIIVFAKIFNQCFGSGYTFRWLLNLDLQSKWKIFEKIFATFISFICERQKQFFEKFSRKYKNENLRLIPNYTLKIHVFLLTVPQFSADLQILYVLDLFLREFYI
jgi:hypothetical protein